MSRIETEYDLHAEYTYGETRWHNSSRATLEESKERLEEIRARFGPLNFASITRETYRIQPGEYCESLESVEVYREGKAQR
jgi:hypothetical protein